MTSAEPRQHWQCYYCLVWTRRIASLGMIALFCGWQIRTVYKCIDVSAARDFFSFFFESLSECVKVGAGHRTGQGKLKLSLPPKIAEIVRYLLDFHGWRTDASVIVQDMVRSTMVWSTWTSPALQ